MPGRTFPFASHEVNRIGFGAMQLPGPGVLGPPKDRPAAIRVLQRAVELGVDHIDTAHYYGPVVANELIRESLHPYPDGLLIVTKLGARRDAEGRWHAAGTPDELVGGVHDNLRSLGLDRLPVVNLRVTEPAATSLFDDQLDAMIALRDQGLIGSIGLSNVSLDQLEHGVNRADIACVQNALNVIHRSDAPIVDACNERSIPFVAFFPLGSRIHGDEHVLRHPGVRKVAKRLDATPAQVALAWLLAYSPNVLLIPGTSSTAHLEENLAAADLKLDASDLQTLGT